MNSEYDRFEARLIKRDSGLYLQNKVSAEQCTYYVEQMFGPFEQDEIDHYKKKLTQDGAPVIHELQKQLVGYLYYSLLDDPITFNAIHNQTDYIKLIIGGKRKLLSLDMRILPYVISSKVIRTASRKIIGKKEYIRFTNSPLFQEIQAKYNNEKVIQKVWELIGTVASSDFEIIDWDTTNHCPGMFDGCKLPMINDMINEELLMFIARI